MTCNIRYAGADDGHNGWAYRKDACIEVIRSRAPEIICFQEMWHEQRVDLSAAFDEFSSFGLTSRATDRHPANTIFYRRDLFTSISAGGYWLSETPHVTGSKSWGSADVRLANWVRLEDTRSQKEFRVISTHLDHISQTAREQQARVITEDAGAFPQDYPQVLAGDMNCDGRNKAIMTFTEAGWKDTYKTVHGTDDPGHTFHEFQGPEHTTDIGKMDWIFARGKTQVTGAQVVTDTLNGRYPSDHYFVVADLDI